MHERYIALAATEPGGGTWGLGDTPEAAIKNCRGYKLKKTKHKQMFRFTSELPFAPTNRPATEEEADAWADRYGGLNWIRCEREELATA